MNPKKEDTPASSSESQEDTAQEDTSAATDIPVVTLKNVLSADSAIKLSKVEEQASRNMNGRQDILSAEKDGRIGVRRGMHYLEQVFAEALHEAGKGLFAGADVRDHLGVLDGIGGGGGAGVQQTISLDRFHK